MFSARGIKIGYSWFSCCNKCLYFVVFFVVGVVHGQCDLIQQNFAPFKINWLSFLGFILIMQNFEHTLAKNLNGQFFIDVNGQILKKAIKPSGRTGVSVPTCSCCCYLWWHECPLCKCFLPLLLFKIMMVVRLMFFKQAWPLFLYFFFSTVYNNVLFKICRRLDLNCWPLVLEAPVLATKSQPLPAVS